MFEFIFNSMIFEFVRDSKSCTSTTAVVWNLKVIRQIVFFFFFENKITTNYEQ